MRSRSPTFAVVVLCLVAGAAWAQDTPDNPQQDQAPIHLRMPAPSSPSPPSAAPEATAAGAIHLHLRQPRHAQASVTGIKHQAGAPATIPLSLDGGIQPPSSPPTPIARAVPPAPAHAGPLAAPAIAPQAAAGESGDRANLTKRGAILFEKDASAPSPVQYHGLQLLAGDLNSALEAGASRIQLEAYGGAPGDKSSDARRLSLRRALAVRQLLIDDGIPSNRIDVRAMGGVDDKGPADRVDVFVRTG
jgi:outer membrane protein OmpA-like peptidoglycan-associated protein